MADPIELPSFVSEGIASLETGTESLCKATSNFCQFGSTLNSLLPDLPDFSQITAAIEEAMGAASTAIGTITKAINDALAPVYEIIDQINTAIENAIGAVADALSAAGSAIMDTLGSAFETFNAAIASLTGAVQGVIDLAVGELSNLVSNIKISTCEEAASSVASIPEGASGFIDEISNGIAGGIDSFSSNFGPGVESALLGSSTSINNATSTASSASETVIVEIADQLSALGSLII